jgi:hypothetical protein
MILAAGWAQKGMRFDTAEMAWKFLASIDHSKTYLSDSRVSDWYLEGYTGGFTWNWHGDTEEEKAEFFSMWGK